MSRAIVIIVECSDLSDMDWLRNRIVPAVEEIVEEQKEDGRIDGEVEVGWTYEDGE